ncbi:hypothetical protein RTP6_006771 [Batrachochytrium dendrobatidis]
MDQLPKLLNEYFEIPSTSSQRKQEIESHLESLRKQRSNIPVCKQILQNPQSSTSYTHWFCLTVFEELLPTWNSKMTVSGRQQVKEFLWTLLINPQYPEMFASFVATKLATLIVHIARQEMPSEWPTFFEDVLALQTTDPQLCLNLLKLAVEEFMFIRQDSNMIDMQQTQLKSIIASRAPRICHVVIQVLDHIYQTQVQRIGSNSPSVSSSTTLNVGTAFYSPYKSELASLSPGSKTSDLSPLNRHLLNSYESPLNRSLLDDAHTVPLVYNASLDSHYITLCQTSLDIMHSLLSWIPLEDPLPVQSIVKTLLCYSQFTDDSMSNLGSQSLSCINEVLQRKYTPQGHNEFISLLINHISEILRYLMSSQDSSVDHPRLQDIDSDYLCKFTDLIGHFISQHSYKAETENGSHFSEFLRLFYNYTFAQQSSEDFLACLDIWKQFIGIMLDRSKKMDSTASTEYLIRYHGGLVGIVDALFKLKSSSSTIWNSEERKLIEQHSLDVIVNVADLFPSDILQRSFDLFTTHSTTIFQRLDGQSPTADTMRECTLSIEMALLVFGRISHLFTNDFDRTFAASFALVDQFCTFQEFLLRHNVMLNESLPTTVMNTLILYVHWFTNFHQAAQTNSEMSSKFDNLVFKITLICTQSLTINNQLLQFSSSRLLRAMSETVRPDLFKIPHVVKCLSELHNIAFNTTSSTRDGLYQFATNLFVLPVLNAKIFEEEWKERSRMYQQLMQPLVTAFVELVQGPNFSNTAQQPQIQQQIVLSIEAFVGCLHAIEAQGTFPKETVFEALQATIASSMSLLNVYSNDNAMLCVLLDYITLLFNALRAQNARENMDLFTQTIQLFMQMLKGESLTKHIQQNLGSAVVEKAINFLSTTIDHPHKGSSTILPQIISFCVQDLYPQCIDGNNTFFDSIRPLFYDMLYRILLNHWRYFFNARVGIALGGDPTDCKNETEFMAIIQIFMLSFQGTHVDMIKQTMTIFEQLNEKCRLFSRPVFVQNIAPSIIKCVLDILLQKTLELLRDDLIQFMGNIVTADPSVVYSKVVTHFFIEKCKSFTKEQQNMLGSRLENIKDLESSKEGFGLFIKEYAYFQSHMRNEYAQ